MLNVLLVDDEPAARTAFRDLLPEGEGGYCLCGTVSNGQEALEFLRCSPVEVVVTDLKMPVMDGLTLIHRLKEKGFPGAILVLSNYSDFALVREALLSGAQDYILKVDMDQDSLREQLDRAVQKLGGPAALAPVSRQETPPDSEGLLYRLLLVGAEEGEGPLPAAPYGLFVVRLEPAAGRRPVSEHSVRRVLESVLDNMESLQLQEKEYLCLASLPADNAGGTAATCAEQLVRQLRMYLNCASKVVYTAPIASAAQLRPAFLELLPKLLRTHLPPPYTGANREVQAVTQYIREHYMCKVTLEEIAASVNLDKSYLCRLFKRETGQSVFQCLNNERMARALGMIAQGNAYVREVAAAVGIDDPFYFTRLFKKTYGISPSEYKEKTGQQR